MQGSLIRPEATGYGAIYFINEILARHNENVTTKQLQSQVWQRGMGTAKKAAELGAKVVTISGPDGYVYDPDGISGEKVDFMLQLRASNMDTVKPFAEKFGVQYFPGKKPWEQKVDIAIPCAIQNELDLEDAKMW